MLYKAITKCRWCGDISEIDGHSSSIALLKSNVYVHQCDVRFDNRKGIADLVGFITSHGQPPERISTLDEPNRIQDSEDTLKPETG